MTCPNRIKPKLLRDIKTEALLVFVRTTLEEYFNQIDRDGYYFQLGTKEDNQFIHKNLRYLLDEVQETAINSSYLRSLIENASKNATLKILAKKEEPLMVYYDTLIKTIEKSLPNGSFWIPELVVICLLSEWIIEEEKTTYFYPYLKNIDYLDLHYKNYYTSIVTPIISGIAEIGYYRDHNYKHEDETFYILKNKFETEMFSCIKRDRKIESNYKNLNNISVDVIDSFNCVHNVEEYSESIKDFFNKMILDRKSYCDVIKLECLDSPKFTEYEIQKLYNILREVIKDNPDTIILEELSNRTIVSGYDLTKAKKEVLEKFNEKEISKSDVLKIFKLMSYDNTDFKNILEIDDYSERKEKNKNNCLIL